MARLHRLLEALEARRPQLRQEGLERLEPLGANDVEAALALRLDGDEAGVLEDLEVLRDRLLRDVMPTDETLAVVRAYHRAWNHGDYEQAGARLAPDLDVEVPINAYGNAAEFTRALAGFGDMVSEVELLAELADGDEAMLLYDLTAEPIGALRVAEHFTVADGRIVRLRQIHDTAALRATGF
jgi:ketosteroid isomerase-like protein